MENAIDCKAVFSTCRYAEFAFLLLWLWVQMNNASPGIVGTVHSAFVWLWVATQYITSLLILNYYKISNFRNYAISKLVCCIPLTIWNVVSGYYMDSDDTQIFIMAESVLLGVYLLMNVPMVYFLDQDNSTMEVQNTSSMCVDAQNKKQHQKLISNFVY